MKKCLLLFCLSIAVNHVFANFISQGNWRWRKDDGTQTSATALADQNTAPTITSYDNVRLRLEFYNPQSGALPLDNTSLAYSTTGADGSWILISDTTTKNDFALAQSPFVTNFEATTQQLASRTGYTFQPGKVITTLDVYTDTLLPNKSTEYEWVIKPTANAKLNTTYYFETSILGYDMPLPTLTIGAVLPVTITSFSVGQKDNNAIVKWTTATETNNNYFDILRSANGQSWQTIATVKAKGNGTAQNNYEITDNTPLPGNSYYRLRQTDKDGKATLSEVKPFTLANLKDFVASVYPNPTAAAINVVVKNYSGSLTATVTNAGGAVVHKEVLAISTGTSFYKLTISQKLPSGTYYISLSGNNFSQKAKVIVQ